METELRRALAGRSPVQGPHIRPVSQVLLRVQTHNQTASSFDVVRGEVLDFIQRRAGLRLPDDAWQGRSFELEEIGAQRTAAVALDSPRYWAARLDDADRSVAQRSWIVEIGLGEAADKSAVLGCRLLCVTRGDYVPFERTVPRFIRDLVEKESVELDGRRISTWPWVVPEGEVDDLVDLLRDDRRKSDVIVFSLPEDSVDPGRTIANAHAVAIKTAGVAHVVIITGPASYVLTDRIGREFSVFRQAVRTYRPGFDPDVDELFKHPMAVADRILSWLPDGVPAYERLLVSQAMIRTVSGGDFEDRVPPFALVRRQAAESRLAHSQSEGRPSDEYIELLEHEIGALRRSLDEERETSGGLLKHADEELNEAQQAAAQAQALNVHLRQRIESFEEQLRNGGTGSTDVPIPNNTKDFEVWCQRHLSGSVEVLNRANQSVKKSELEDVSLIYKALLLLRDYYVPMRRAGGSDLVRKYQAACNDLGMSEEPTFSGARAGEEGDTYFVSYAGRRVELDRYLKKGNSREPRFCFRVYFFWDEESAQAVVGSLPQHLATRAS